MIDLDGNSLTLEHLVAIARGGTAVALADAARGCVRAARAVVGEYAQHDDPTYGINTGFGDFAEVKIPAGSLSQLQINLVRSHAAGVASAKARRRTALLESSLHAAVRPSDSRGPRLRGPANIGTTPLESAR